MGAKISEAALLALLPMTSRVVLKVTPTAIPVAGRSARVMAQELLVFFLAIVASLVSRDMAILVRLPLRTVMTTLGMVSLPKVVAVSSAVVAAMPLGRGAGLLTVLLMVCIRIAMFAMVPVGANAMARGELLKLSLVPIRMPLLNASRTAMPAGGVRSRWKMMPLMALLVLSSARSAGEIRILGGRESARCLQVLTLMTGVALMLALVIVALLI